MTIDREGWQVRNAGPQEAPPPYTDQIPDGWERGHCEREAEAIAQRHAATLPQLGGDGWRALLPSAIEGIRSLPDRPDDGKGEEGGIACGDVVQRVDLSGKNGANCFERAVLGGSVLQRADLPWRIISGPLPAPLNSLHTVVQAWTPEDGWTTIPLDPLPTGALGNGGVRNALDLSSLLPIVFSINPMLGIILMLYLQSQGSGIPHTGDVANPPSGIPAAPPPAQPNGGNPPQQAGAGPAAVDMITAIMQSINQLLGLQGGNIQAGGVGKTQWLLPGSVVIQVPAAMKQNNPMDLWPAGQIPPAATQWQNSGGKFTGPWQYQGSGLTYVIAEEPDGSIYTPDPNNQQIFEIVQGGRLPSKGVIRNGWIPASWNRPAPGAVRVRNAAYSWFTPPPPPSDSSGDLTPVQAFAVAVTLRRAGVL